MRPLPPSPFGPAQPLDLEGQRFGAFMPDSPTGPARGFFIFHEDLAPRMQDYARACPGAGADQAFLAVALPAAIAALADEWRDDPDWIERMCRSGRPRRNPAQLDGIQVQPWTFSQPVRKDPADERFAFIKGPRLPGWIEDDSSRERFFKFWIQELESFGLRCVPWTGKSLDYFSHGHLGDDLLAQARQDCENATLALKLDAEIPPASSSPGPRL